MRKGAIRTATLASVRRAIGLWGEGHSYRNIGLIMGFSGQHVQQNLLKLAQRHFTEQYLEADASHRKLAASGAILRRRIPGFKQTVTGWLLVEGYIRCRDCKQVRCEDDFSAGVRAGTNKTVRCCDCCRLVYAAWRKRHGRGIPAAQDEPEDAGRWSGCREGFSTRPEAAEAGLRAV